jgi:hypothetical protein
MAQPKLKVAFQDDVEYSLPAGRLVGEPPELRYSGDLQSNQPLSL